mgnify:CR=1 FL=1
MAEKLLEVKNLTIEFPVADGMRTVVDHVNFSLSPGEIVGESGSGKTITVQTIMGLKKPDAHIKEGEILFNGTDLLQISDEELAKIQGNDMSMVFQEPMTSLNPVKKIGWQVAESLRIHTSMSDDEIQQRVVEILANVGLPKPEELCNKYPHQLSGGMRQRVMIAMAMICWPKLLVCDEPTTALDVTVQAQILQLLRKIHEEANTSILFISHDLNVVKEVCQRVIVMYKGKIVEEGYTEDVLYHPKHEYTKHLIAAIPTNRQDMREEEYVVEAKNLNVYYSTKGKGIFAKKEEKKPLIKPKKKHRYVPPKLEFLTKDNKAKSGDDELATRQAEIINRTFREANIGAEVVKYIFGPTVTQFLIKVNPGVNVRVINNVESNLTMYLETERIRIQTPIPGKSFAGIEVPRKPEQRRNVMLGDILSSKEFKESSLYFKLI